MSDRGDSQREPELSRVLARLQQEVEAIGTRGLRAVSNEQLAWLRHTSESIGAMGAEFMSSRIRSFLEAQQAGRDDSARCFLELLTTLRVFERVLTLEVIQEQLQMATAKKFQKRSDDQSDGKPTRA